MLFRQLIDAQTSTYTYLLADLSTREAVLIDPVKGQVSLYLKLLEELELRLSHALDTHVHADHVTALGMLRDLTHCRTYIGHEGSVSFSDASLEEGMLIPFGSYGLLCAIRRVIPMIRTALFLRELQVKRFLRATPC